MTNLLKVLDLIVEGFPTYSDVTLQGIPNHFNTCFFSKKIPASFLLLDYKMYSSFIIKTNLHNLSNYGA